MARPDKVAAVAELAEKFRRSNAAVLTEYRGLTVAQLTQLRLTISSDACIETLAVLITMAWADGRLDDHEKEGVRAAASVLNLTKELRDRLDQLLQKPISVDELLVDGLSPRDKAFAYATTRAFQFAGCPRCGTMVTCRTSPPPSRPKSHVLLARSCAAKPRV